jgi:hypothetical protein
VLNKDSADSYPSQDLNVCNATSGSGHDLLFHVVIKTANFTGIVEEKIILNTKKVAAIGFTNSL